MNATVSSSALGRKLFAGMIILQLALEPSARGDAPHSDFTASYLGQRLGLAQKATTFPGITVREKDGGKVGKVDDVVIDLHSGRVLCALVCVGGAKVALPGRIFHSSDESQAQLDLDAANLDGVPGVNDDLATLLSSLPETYKHFGRPVFWDSAATPLPRKCREFIGLEVRNEAGESLGHVVNVMVDLPTGRVIYVVVSASGKAADDLFAVPPKAFQPSSDKNMLLLNVDKMKISAVAHSDSFFWSNMADPTWGGNAYHDFGEQADFDSAGTPPVQPVGTADEIKKSFPVKSDQEIAQDILAALMHDSTNDPLIFRHAKIKPVNGKVVLSGYVKNEEQRSKLLAIVSGVVGTVNINNQLLVK